LIPYIVIEQLYLVFLFEYQFILLSWISQEYTTSGIRTIDVNQFCIKGPVVFAIFCSIISELAHPNSSLANAYLSAYLWSHVPCLLPKVLTPNHVNVSLHLAQRLWWEPRSKFGLLCNILWLETVNSNRCWLGS